MTNDEFRVSRLHNKNAIALAFGIKVFKCLRCGHEWPSKQERPRVCPKCKSPYWDKERKNA